MAQESEKFTPITFTKKSDDGETTRELTAMSAADEVHLRFEGWREKKAPGRTAARPAASS
jgi:hypothetical protein